MSLIIAAHDLSGVGRCSLTTAIAVLASMGHSCYPLPTAVLSQQTAFEGYSFLDFTNHMPSYLKSWRALGVKPDMIYTGFLGNGKQASMLGEFISEHPSAEVVIDPVMGDGGEIYGCYKDDFVTDMQMLAKSAHILLPNATEFNLLTGRPPNQPLPRDDEEILKLSSGLNAPRLKYIVITSAEPVRGGQSGMCNLIVGIGSKTVTELAYSGDGVSYSGSGDLFASVVCGFLSNGMDMTEAVQYAAKFVSDAAGAMPGNADSRYGIRYEKMLSRLIGLS